MDLESTNGSFLNGTRIESARFYELRHGDLLKFANVGKEYHIFRKDELMKKN